MKLRVVIYIIYVYSCRCSGHVSCVGLLVVFAGTVMLNPNTHDSPSIKILYKEYSSTPIIYPKLESVLEVASKEMDTVSVYNSIAAVCDISLCGVTISL